jgi:S-DNA-T family DNA segregation ATPase FtsK/SpoIIIE
MIFEDKAVYLPNVADMYDSDLALITYINRLDTDDKEKVFDKNNVDNITDFLKKEVTKKGADNVYKNTIKSFISSNELMNLKNMKTEDNIKLRFAQHGFAINYIDEIKGLSVDLIRFEVGVGVKLNKLKSFLPDIEMTIGKTGARILAPVPNTKYIGFEIPKEKREFIKEKPNGSGYNIVFGKDVYNNDIVTDIRLAPHILVAGASGSGKTYFLQSIAKQIIKDSNCELIIIDPKQIDFQDFEKIATVKTEILEIEELTFRLVIEMEERYRQLKKEKKKSIENTNLKYKFVIIDEYSDLAMTKSGKEISDNIKKIAQKGRACGIHLIIATQRPSVKVIDGDIKTNFPIKIAFKLPKAVDSNVVLGEDGAEKLLGKGDGLINGLDGGSTIRFQAFSKF